MLKGRLKHEKIAIGMALIGLTLLGISVLPFGCETWTGILQGVGTGLFTGVVILCVGGTKSYEINDNSESIDFLREYCKSIYDIYEIKIDIENRVVIVKNIEYSIVMIPYVIFKYKNFFEKYCGNDTFDRIVPEIIRKFQKELTEDYYEQIKKLCDDCGERTANYDEFQKFVHEIYKLHPDFCESIFDSDIDSKIDRVILTYKEKKAKLSRSKI